MLFNTFCHLPGISPRRERELWDAGILTWTDFLEADDLPMSKVAADKARAGLTTSMEALEQRDLSHFFDSLKKEQWRVFPHFRDSIAYIDIETTGANCEGHVITTICLWNGEELRSFVRGENLEDFVDEILQYKLLVSFNGKCFDLPFIRRVLDCDMDAAHIDLRYVMSGIGYKGGLKRVETALGIDRRDLADVSGAGAVMLWHHYRRTGNRAALDTLLAYNALDVINLERLMVKAYNIKLEETVFPRSLRLEDTLSDCPPPFPVDPHMVKLAQSAGGMYV